MKLFSKFQDYYDCTLGSFLESDVVIRRETETHKVSHKEFAPLGNFEGKWNYEYEGRFGKTYSTWAMHMIGFCGKWYFFKCDSLEFNRDAINPETISITNCFALVFIISVPPFLCSILNMIL